MNIPDCLGLPLGTTHGRIVTPVGGMGKRYRARRHGSTRNTAPRNSVEASNHRGTLQQQWFTSENRHARQRSRGSANCGDQRLGPERLGQAVHHGLSLPVEGQGALPTPNSKPGGGSGVSHADQLHDGLFGAVGRRDPQFGGRDPHPQRRRLGQQSLQQPLSVDLE